MLKMIIFLSVNVVNIFEIFVCIYPDQRNNSKADMVNKYANKTWRNAFSLMCRPNMRPKYKPRVMGNKAAREKPTSPKPMRS